MFALAAPRRGGEGQTRARARDARAVCVLGHCWTLQCAEARQNSCVATQVGWGAEVSLTGVQHETWCAAPGFEKHRQWRGAEPTKRTTYICLRTRLQDRPEVVPRRSRSWRPARSRRKHETELGSQETQEPIVTAASRRAPSWREPGSKKQLGQRVASVASVGTSVLGEQPKHEHHLARYRDDIGKI